MPLIYEGNSGPVSIKPAPLVSIAKQYIFDEKGEVVTPEYTITLTGTLVGFKSGLADEIPASPEFLMNNIVSQQQELRDLFSKQYGRLQIESPNGGPERIEAYTAVESVDVQSSVWVDRCEYVIVLKTNQLVGEEEDYGDYQLRSRSEKWDVAEQDNGTYILTHSLSAQGLRIGSTSGSIETSNDAKAWCEDHSYAITSSGILSAGTANFPLSRLVSNLSSTTNNFWNYSLAEGAGVDDLSWQLTETFIHNPNGIYREEYSVSTASPENDPIRSSISVEGTIIGMASRDSDYETKLANATTGWQTIQGLLYTRAAEYAEDGMTVRPTPSVKSVSYDVINGSVRYNYTFSASTVTFVDGALEEDLSVEDSGPTDVFAQIVVPGRASGPIFQDIETVTSPTRTVNFSCVMPISPSGTIASLYASKPDVDDIILALVPNVDYYVVTDSESWNPLKGNYSRTVSWAFTDSSTAGVPSAPRSH